MAGLSCRFQLVNGGFRFSEGTQRSRDALWFYCVFDKYRVYYSDFGANFTALLQKPISTIQLNKTLILGRFAQGVRKYVPSVSVKGLDIGYTANNRENLNVLVGYSAVLENKSEVTDVIFV